MSGVEVQQSGAVFDGRAEQQQRDCADEWTRSLATLGASMVRTNLNSVLRKQTPFYRLQVESRPEPPGWKIWDKDVIYGKWLEGTSSRNRTTRFKGYATFRRTVQQINARAEAVGQKIVARFVNTMNS